MYAFTVKNNENTWDIWRTLEDVPVPHKKERLDAALASGYPVIGERLTEYGLSIKSGAVWDGTQWTGGDSTNRTSDNITNLYAYVCNDTIVLIQFGDPNTEQDELMTAVFNSENSMIKVPEGQIANVGDIWDETRVINR